MRMRGRLDFGTRTLLAIGLGASISACPRLDTQPVVDEPPSTLLGRALFEASPIPEVAAAVLEGALTRSSTVHLPSLSKRGVAVAHSVRRPAAIQSMARVLASRGAHTALEDWLSSAAPEQVSLIRGAYIAERARQGDVSFDLNGLDRLGKRSDVDRVRYSVVRGLIASGRLSSAERQIELLSDRRRRDEARVDLTAGYAARGERAKALSLLSRIRSSHHRAQAEAKVARSDQRAGRYRQAIGRAGRIESRLIRAKALADLATDLHRAGRRRGALRTFRRARAEAEAIGDPLLLATALAHVAVKLEASGLRTEAEATLKSLPGSAQAEVRAQWAQAMVARGDLAGARQQLGRLTGPGLVASEAQAAVAELEAKLGHIDSALKRTAGVLVPEVRWKALGRVAALAPDTSLDADGLESLKAALRP